MHPTVATRPTRSSRADTPVRGGGISSTGVLGRLGWPAILAAVALPSMASTATAQTTRDPFPEPIEDEADVVVVGVDDFATFPFVDGEPPRLMTLVDAPGTGRLFVSEMRGTLYTVGYGGGDVTPYLDMNEPGWEVDVESSGRERGVQSFAVHPDFAREGAAGYGKIYVWTDVSDTDPVPDFPSAADRVSHHTVLLEFTAEDATAETYDGGPPRELARFEQPYGNHNGGDVAFNPVAEPGDADYGLLYVGVGDGGAGGDPHDMAQDLSSGFGKVLRIDPLGEGGRNGQYGIPAGNPFAEGEGGALPEIFAYGLRNPQHFAWDAATGQMFVADIGQSTVEEVSTVGAGANLGWNTWEGSFRFSGRGGVDTGDPRSDPDITYPVAEYDHSDPLVGRRAAVSGLVVYRDGPVAALGGKLIFGDLPSGEIFYVPVGELEGGQGQVRRVMLRDDRGEARTLLQLVRERNQEAGRVDLRIGVSEDGRVFLLNKHDGVLRVVG